MTTAFTPVYPLPATSLSMGLNAAPVGQGVPVNIAGGRGTRIPDLRMLLAVHAARQATGHTARIVRNGDLSVVLADEPDRLTLMFASAGTSPSVLRRISGPFHTAVAARLAMGNDGEGGVYLGD